MARPKKGTPEGDLATKKFRETMSAKYGSVNEFFKEIGAKGGKVSRTGGFGNGEAGKELARIAGRKGGLKSKRGKRNDN